MITNGISEGCKKNFTKKNGKINISQERLLIWFLKKQGFVSLMLSWRVQRGKQKEFTEWCREDSGLCSFPFPASHASDHLKWQKSKIIKCLKNKINKKCWVIKKTCRVIKKTKGQLTSFRSGWGTCFADSKESKTGLTKAGRKRPKHKRANRIKIQFIWKS